MWQNDSEFDERFEQALASYADPVDGGETQVLMASVLANIKAAKNRRPRWKLAFIFAIPEFALLALLFLLPHATRDVTSAPQTALEPTPSALAPHPQITSRSEAHVRTKHAVAMVRKVRKQLPKLDQFPTPTPPSEQELLLAYFVQHAPVQMQQTIARAQQQLEEPLHIAELSIAPINLNTQP